MTLARTDAYAEVNEPLVQSCTREGIRRMQQKRTKKNTAHRRRPGANRSGVQQRAKRSVAEPAKLSFRPRTPEDDEYMVQLTEDQLGVVHQQAFQEPFPRDQFLRYLRSGAPTYLIEQSGKRIGYYSYLVGPDAKMHISALVIEPQHQSDGVGTQVMTRLEEEAQRAGVQVMEVFVQNSNEKSLAFTRKLGFLEAFRVDPNTTCFQKRIAQMGQNRAAQMPAGAAGRPGVTPPAGAPPVDAPGVPGMPGAPGAMPVRPSQAAPQQPGPQPFGPPTGGPPPGLGPQPRPGGQPGPQPTGWFG